MQQKLRSWYQANRLYWLAGAALWAAIAVATWQYARTRDLPYLQTMVTMDEWVVAILLLPRLATFLLTGLSTMTRGARMSTAMQSVMYGGSSRAVTDQLAEDLTDETNATRKGWGARLASAAGVTFLLDLMVRALFGLGWQPFV